MARLRELGARVLPATDEPDVVRFADNNGIVVEVKAGRLTDHAFRLARVLPIAGHVPFHHERRRISLRIEVEGEAVSSHERGVGVRDEPHLLSE